MKASRDEGLAEWREKVFQKGKLYREVFNTAAGKKVLKELSDLYIKPDMFDTDSLKMARNVGQHDLVKFIVDMVEIENDR
ncbi:MAG: hypothetical protein DRI98_11635 [Bacteroidetes bacterium]|nr:MAG: hypothetical protein DRI98_11635 [Bacteroidota bacterium]